MYDIERLHTTYANPSNERQSGKTTMNCFNLLGYIDVLNVEQIIVTLQQYNLAWGFALRFDVILKEMGFEYNIEKSGGLFNFYIKDCNGNNKKVSITGLSPDSDELRGNKYALYNIDHNNINNCYLDLSKSGIPSEDIEFELLRSA